MFRTKAIVFAFGLAALATPTFSQGAPPGGVSGQVTVTNPDTSPVPTTVLNPATAPALTSSVDDPGRLAYQSSGFGDCSPGPTFGCEISFSAVPAGHRLVVQHVSGGFRDPTGVIVQLGSTTSGNVESVFSHFLAISVNSLSAFDQPVLMYVDAGDYPEVNLSNLGSTAFSPLFEMTLTGYLLDCTASPCAQIHN